MKIKYQTIIICFYFVKVLYVYRLFSKGSYTFVVHGTQTKDFSNYRPLYQFLSNNLLKFYLFIYYYAFIIFLDSEWSSWFYSEVRFSFYFFYSGNTKNYWSYVSSTNCFDSKLPPNNILNWTFIKILNIFFQNQ